MTMVGLTDVDVWLSAIHFNYSADKGFRIILGQNVATARYNTYETTASAVNSLRVLY